MAITFRSCLRTNSSNLAFASLRRATTAGTAVAADFKSAPDGSGERIGGDAAGSWLAGGIAGLDSADKTPGVVLSTLRGLASRVPPPPPSRLRQGAPAAIVP